MAAPSTALRAGSGRPGLVLPTVKIGRLVLLPPSPQLSPSNSPPPTLPLQLSPSNSPQLSNSPLHHCSEPDIRPTQVAIITSGGGNSSTGRAPDCGSDGCGFDSRFPPQVFKSLPDGPVGKCVRRGDPFLFENCGPVAQLDRASVFGTEGWGFEPLRGHQYQPCFPCLRCLTFAALPPRPCLCIRRQSFSSRG